MKWLQLFFYSVIFLSALFADAVTEQDTGDFHICYFSLNNEKEFTEMEKFTKRLNKHSHCSISVNEYMTENEDPEESFRKMIESGVHCDGLVISGHHTGSFGGKRSTGSLSIDFLEQLSCKSNERYSKWFNNINALWLQGCRTLGTGEIVREEDEVDADYHTARVGDVLDVDHLEQSFADLNMEFSATLDQDNPLSSRYLRTFPAATVFGWTKTAPGERAGSQYSLPFHMAHISRLINNQDGFPKDSPIKGTWTKDSAVKYSTAMLSLLNGEYQCQELAVEAWKKHGKVTDQSTEYGFFNPDLNAYTALMNTDDEVLKQARIYNCLLKHSDDEKLLEVLDLILKDQTFIRYTYNSLLENLQRLKERNPDLHSKMVEKLKASKVIRAFLNKKLTGKRLGILRKIDYFAFYKEIYGENKKLEDLIMDKAIEAFEKIPSDSYDQMDYKKTLLSSLSKHGYLDNDRGISLLTKGLNDSTPYIRQTAIKIAGKIGEKGLPIVEQGFQDSDYDVRETAIMAAASIGEKGLPIVEQGLQDSEYYVRKTAVRAAGKIGEKALPMVNRAFKHSNKYIRGIAIQAAGKIGEKGLPIVEQGLQDSEYYVKLEAVRAAGEIGKEKKALLFLEKAGGLPLLEQGLQDSDENVRETAIMAAASIGEKGLPIVEQGIKDSEEYIRWVAIDSAREIAQEAIRRVDEIAADAGEMADEIAADAGEMADEIAADAGEMADEIAADAGEMADEIAADAGEMADEIEIIKTTVSILEQGLEDSESYMRWESKEAAEEIEDEIDFILRRERRILRRKNLVDDKARMKVIELKELRDYIRDTF